MASAQGLTENYGPVVDAIVTRGNTALETYTPEDAVLAGNEFSRLYFDVLEGSGMEFTLNLKDNSLMLQIESNFSLIISECMRGADKTQLEKTWAVLQGDLNYAVEHYSSGEESPDFSRRIVQSFLILFREGIEAMLVVAALIAYLRRSGYSDKVKVILWSCAIALVASAGAAWLLHAVLEVSGANREVLEGATMLLAALVLIYVSYWLTAKRDADRWQAFVEDKMDQAIQGGSMFALGFVAFLAVFREGAETILFYQALMIGSS
jgi:high-affinity iron transporter